MPTSAMGPTQMQGVDWLNDLHRQQAGGILGDSICTWLRQPLLPRRHCFALFGNSVDSHFPIRGQRSAGKGQAVRYLPLGAVSRRLYQVQPCAMKYLLATCAERVVSHAPAAAQQSVPCFLQSPTAQLTRLMSTVFGLSGLAAQSRSGGGIQDGAGSLGGSAARLRPAGPRVLQANKILKILLFSSASHVHCTSNTFGQRGSDNHPSLGCCRPGVVIRSWSRLLNNRLEANHIICCLYGPALLRRICP